MSRISKHCKDLFITAWEGGSSYWASVSEPNNSEKTFDKIVNEGYVLKVRDREDLDEVWTVQKSDLVGSITKLKNEHPRHYADLVEDSWDAETADVWFQLVVIGELTFG